MGENDSPGANGQHGTGIADPDRFMMPRFPFLRLILAALVCAGLCAFNWNQFSYAEAEISDDLVITESTHAAGHLFATSNQESTRGVSQPDRVELTPFVFGVDKALALSPPVFAVVANVAEAWGKGGSVLIEGVKNKDPPVV